MSKIANTTRARRILGSALTMPHSKHFFTRVSATGNIYIVSHYREKMLSLLAAKGYSNPSLAIKYGIDFSGYYMKTGLDELLEISSLIAKIDPS